MTLIFSGNEFKYELESVMKLFLPAQLFKHIYTPDKAQTKGDHAFMRRVKLKRRTLLYVVCFYGGKTVHESSSTDNSEEEYDLRCQLELSRLLYRAMSRLTGITPEWGIITGVRPVKRVNKMIAQGIGRDGIFSALKNEFYVSDSKCRIAYDTAMTQEKLTADLPADSFSLYVSIPFCPTRCDYCSFVSQSIDRCRGLIPQYVDNLCRELGYIGKIVQKIGLKLYTVYFGGGTPTTLEALQLDRIMKEIASDFDMSGVREYTVEAGRADTVTAQKLEVIRKNGCKRISVNPQTLNDKVLEVIGRKHTAKQFFEAFELARKMGFYCINTDVIAGLPADTPESFRRTIDRLTELSAENITVHTLSIKRAANLNHTDNKSEIFHSPAREMVGYAEKTLPQCGYSPYYLYRQKNMLDNLENIGWSKKGYESLYNIFIMEEIQTIIAAGAGGSTKLVDRANGRLERIFNYKFPLEYNKNFELMLSRKDRIGEFYNEYAAKK